MSYRCQVCGEQVQPGQPMRRVVVRRPDGQTARELRACPPCAAGAPPEQQLKQRPVIIPLSRFQRSE